MHSLFPGVVSKLALRKETVILCTLEQELIKVAPRLVALDDDDDDLDLYISDCKVPCSVSIERPDLLRLVQEKQLWFVLEVEEHGHGFKPDKYATIRKTFGCPGVVFRIDPDRPQMLARSSGKDSLSVYAPGPAFDRGMRTLVGAIKDHFVAYLDEPGLKGALRLQAETAQATKDELSPFWGVKFVHLFFNGPQVSVPALSVDLPDLA